MALRRGTLSAVALALLIGATGHAQFVPPKLEGIRGDTPVGTREIPLPRANQQWIRVTSPSFMIISSAPEGRAREVAETLESVAAALRQVHPRFDARFTDTTVFLFHRRADSQPFFDVILNQKRATAPGVFLVQRDGSAVMIIDADRPVATDRTVKHELMHNILAASGAQLPLWLEEGIAEYFSTTAVSGETVVVGRPILQHQAILRSRGTLRMEDLIGARHGSSITNHVLFYPQAWAMVDWMMRTNREAFYEFVAEVESGSPVDESFRRRFHLGIETAARSLRQIVRPSASSTMRTERTHAPLAASRISYADAVYEIGRFLGRLDSRREEAERYLTAALDLEPGHARAKAALGVLRSAERRYDEATAFFEDAIALDPHDPVVQTAFAESLLRDAIGTFAGVSDPAPDAAARLRRARELALAALATEPTPIAQAIVGTSYLVEDDPAPGVPYLQRARAARPSRLDFALNLYALHLRLEAREEADALFEAAFQRSRDPQVVFAARNVYVREQLARANRLIAKQRLEEAAALVRDLAQVTPDEQAKVELLSQADKVIRVAASNREILAYNEAVEAFNQNQPRAALEMLDRLLDSATDPSIREKAEQLRIATRKRLRGM